MGFVSEYISPFITLFITLSESSQAAWKKLATTYAKPSHTWIHHLKENLTHLSHDTLIITRYMQQSKDYDDALTLVDAPIGETFLIIRILDGLISLQDIWLLATQLFYRKKVNIVAKTFLRQFFFCFMNVALSSSRKVFVTNLMFRL